MEEKTKQNRKYLCETYLHALTSQRVERIPYKEYLNGVQIPASPLFALQPALGPLFPIFPWQNEYLHIAAPWGV